MCLNPEWFAKADERQAKRMEHGVTLAEAQRDLKYYRSTAAPIAYEMAEWIYKHWTLEQFMQLNTDERDLILRYIRDRHGVPNEKAEKKQNRYRQAPLVEKQKLNPSN